MPAIGLTERGMVAVATVGQWQACRLTGTVVDRPDRAVTLEWAAPAAGPGPVAAPATARAGLVFDPACRLYHARPEEGRIQRVRWPWPAGRGPAPEVDLLARPEPAPGPFRPTEAQDVVRAVALAADADGYLMALDGPTSRVLVLDVAERRPVRTLALPGPVLDLAPVPGGAVAAVDGPAPLWRVHPLAPPVPLTDGLPPGPGGAAPRVVWVSCAPDGTIWVLVEQGAELVLERVGRPLPAGRGPLGIVTGLAVDADGLVVVAGPRGAPLRRFLAGDGSVEELPPLTARGYDGRGITRTPDGHIGFWALPPDPPPRGRPPGAEGLATAVRAAVRRRTSGAVDTICLDGGVDGRVWGRIFVDACAPPGTEVRVEVAIGDDPPGPESPEGPTLPPPPDAAALAGPTRPGRPLHRRETGGELGWPRMDERYETYEAPVHAEAGPGRYLRVRLLLLGTPRVSPRVRALRVECPGHDLLSRLPAIYRQDPVAASFLDRFLAPPAGLLDELAERSAQRHALLDPWAAPADLLPWLGSLVGWVLDDRWPEAARRRVLDEAMWLFRFRGTVHGLERLIHLVVGVRPVIIERFRLRGSGDATVGATGPVASTSVLGGGFRVGGAAGREGATTVEGDPRIPADAFAATAHRFTVIVPRLLDADERAALDHLLDLHRPAHTIVDVCTAGTGMRVGVGLHVELSSLVGPGSGFVPLEVGGLLGRDAVVAGRVGGVRPEASRVGQTTTVDR